MIAVIVLTAAAAVAGAQDAAPEPDNLSLNWIRRAVAWYPNSTFELVENTRYQTPNGSYRVVRVDRECASRLLSGQPSALVDETTNSIWLGIIGELPFAGIGAGVDAVKTFVEGFLPEALQSSMNMRVRVEWDAGPRRPGALIPMSLMVQTGYGEYRRPAAVTADGKYLVMATEGSLDGDPVAARRRQLAASDLVMWDAEAGAEAKVEIVEFSDFECPACRGKWDLIKRVVGDTHAFTRHGMVSFPLTMIHPWAFRAASATWCISQQDPQQVIPLKELFYGLQREMEVSLVTPTAVDFIAGSGLDESGFLECYLRDPSLAAVHRQMSLGQELGVSATPTYFVNGWKIQVPEEDWFPEFVADLAAGKEPL